MEHSDFVTKYRAGQIAVNIDKNKAGFMYKSPDLMPQSLRIKQSMFRTFAFGGVLLGFALYFFTPWWLATIVLGLSLFMFPGAQAQAASGVLAAALEDSRIYQVAIDNHVLVVRERV